MNTPPNREVALFSAALELPSSQRAAYLNEACADDPALRLRLEALLRVHEEALPFLEARASGAQESPMGAGVPGATIRINVAPSEKAGDRIGRYKLLQQIGEGGCGVVYMAEQAEPVRRRVALKVIKLGMDTKQVIARFEAERQALAMMDHPSIAKVFDAGATETGRPYFVMELVRGVKITDYCDEASLSTRERLDLFIQVCHAIQHAHQKGVIHRDIKPSNILVTVNDGVAVPKVIDFGIAKATNHQPLADKTVFTAFEQFLGTPAYMSPEQAVMTSLDVDTRSDIYSLGVLLYELLTGKTPLDQKVLLAAGLEEMRRTIREQEPARPSTRLSNMLAGDLTTTAKHRHTDAPKLIHLLRGDLDWIVMKALEKDRARRYDTANGLAMDVQRYLTDEPVAARPPSKLYRFQKMARRNKLIFAAGSAVLIALVAGLAVSNWFFLREKTARRRAIAAEQQARAINKFLTEGLLFQATPEQNAREKKVTMEEVLNLATSNLDHNAEIARQPELEATLRLDLGTTYELLGTLAEAGRNLRLAFNLRRSALGPEHLDTLAAEHELAMLLSGQRKHEECQRLAHEAWQGRLRLLGAEDTNTLSSQELYEEALGEQGKLQEAEPIARQLLQIRERVLGPDDPATISSLGNLGELLQIRGGNAEAEPYIREALTRFQRIGFADKHNGFLCVKELALLRLLQGDPAEAENLLEDALSRARKRFGPDNYLTLFIQRVLVRALAEEGRLVEAEALGKETLDARLRTKANQDDVGTGRTLLYLGRVLVEQSKLDEAEPRLQEALTIFRKDDSNKTRPELAAQAENWLGSIQVARKAYPEAEALMRSGFERFFAANAEMSPNERRVTVGHIVQLYQAWDKPEETTRWQKKLDQLAPVASNQ
jgi:eukaryotic-like serine/threonine-protein kinase